MPRRSTIPALAPASSPDLPRRQTLAWLFDRQGRIRTVLRHEQTADDHTADVRALLAEPPV
ncbi:hypothetical protein [Hydrogenophaga sp.]|uniref:hypothetical protein n=1 Tax=Hydrogenophaga sp. TaxID=1904254 RepID=UPI00286E82F9|nr:hypothetical protein [Hydrogenophaga sp.]